MKPTNDKVFLDSNILIYGYSNSEANKQAIARKLISENVSYISTQVLQEVVNIVTRKFKFGYADAESAVMECCNNNMLHANTEDTIIQACKVAERYGFSFYDSLIIAAAIESGRSVLYSEDLHHTLRIEQLTIVNPFVQ